jgi:exopolysaccharide production protein ExoZ
MRAGVAPAVPAAEVPGGIQPEADRKTYLTLQAGRGLAALAVVLTHAQGSAGSFIEPSPQPLGGILHLGYLGVDFFFVLSGFIILHSHRSDPETFTALKTYVFKRITRVYVPYLPVACALMLVYTVLPGVRGGDHDWGLLSTLMLVPSNHPPILLLAWTLIHEMVFYAIFATYFRWRRAFQPLLGLWLAGMFLNAALIYPLPPLARVVFAPINVEFIFGMAAAILSTRINRKYGLPCLAAGLVVALLAATLVFMQASPRHFFALAMACVVLGAVLAEHRLRVPKVLSHLGDASYSVYLVHYPAMSLAVRGCALLGTGWYLGVLVIGAVGTIAGVLYHEWFERHALAFFRRVGEAELRVAR